MAKIYTKTGDRGQTSLMDGSRVPKSDIRVETYGTIDELNAAIGVAIAELPNVQYSISNIQGELISIQKDLFELGSMLANPATSYDIPTTGYFDGRIKNFEQFIDDMTTKLPLLSNFILPGGGKAGSQLHVARTICRRVERRIIALSQDEKIDGVVIRYINRLSDLLFTMSRYVNWKEKKKEVIWVKR